MQNNIMKPTTRFTEKAKYYHATRPSYPKEVLMTIIQMINLEPNPSYIIADIGSGTGKLSEVFLKYGFTVIGIEPNKAMREIGETEMKKYENFISMDGTAETTRIKDHSIDLIIAGQSFHWFNLAKTRKEFQRILKPDGYAMIVWNNRNTESSHFFRDYETILKDFGTDYHEVTKTIIGKKEFSDFFGTESYETFHFKNTQQLDYEGIRGRLLSTSYVPTEKSESYPPMIQKLKQIFQKHQKNNLIELNYETIMYLSKISTNNS